MDWYYQRMLEYILWRLDSCSTSEQAECMVFIEGELRRDPHLSEDEQDMIDTDDLDLGWYVSTIY
jgi:hypothetical protein